MTQDQIDLFNSLAPNKQQEVGIGQMGLYREGIMKAKVKVLSKELKNDWFTIEVEVVGESNVDDLLKPGCIFKLGKKEGYDGYVGWTLTPLPDYLREIKRLYY